MATRPQADWLTLDVAYGEPDPVGEAAALAALVLYSRERGYPEQYPVSERVLAAIHEREIHFGACPACSADALCDEWWRLAAVAQDAIEQERRTA